MKLIFFRDKKVFFNSGAKFTWGKARSRLGNVCVIWRDDAIVSLSFYDDENERENELSKYGLINKKPTQDDQVKFMLCKIINKKDRSQYAQKIKLAFCSSEFQECIWKCLARTSWGSRITYQQLAQAADRPTAVRAVGNACASNPIAIWIPCHRVISANPKQINYRWGSWRKLYLLDMEAFGR